MWKVATFANIMYHKKNCLCHQLLSLSHLQMHVLCAVLCLWFCAEFEYCKHTTLASLCKTFWMIVLGITSCRLWWLHCNDSIMHSVSSSYIHAHCTFAQHSLPQTAWASIRLLFQQETLFHVCGGNCAGLLQWLYFQTASWHSVLSLTWSLLY